MYFFFYLFKKIILFFSPCLFVCFMGRGSKYRQVYFTKCIIRVLTKLVTSDLAAGHSPSSSSSPSLFHLNHRHLCRRHRLHHRRRRHGRRRLRRSQSLLDYPVLLVSVGIVLIVAVINPPINRPINLPSIHPSTDQSTDPLILVA